MTCVAQGLIGKNQPSNVDKELSGATLRDLWDNSSNVVTKPLAPIGGGVSVHRTNQGEAPSESYRQEMFVVYENKAVAKSPNLYAFFILLPCMAGFCKKQCFYFHYHHTISYRVKVNQTAVLRSKHNSLNHSGVRVETEGGYFYIATRSVNNEWILVIPVMSYRTPTPKAS